MENISPCLSSPPKQPSSNLIAQAHPFSQEWVTITKEEQINLIHQAHYWKAQHAQLKQKVIVLEEENQYKNAKIKDLQNRLFGKKSEKQGLAKSEKNNPTASHRNRGQQPQSPDRPSSYGQKDSNPQGKMDAGQANGISAEKCAKKIIRAIQKNKAVAYIGGKELLMVHLKRFFPRIFFRIVSKIDPT